jgi:ABC-type iron transport system FetAB ATPase subunit
MKNRELICSTLIDHLTSSTVNRGTVSILSGPWGCGKTYLWNKDILPQLSGKAIITLSLFGLESMTALKI